MKFSLSGKKKQGERPSEFRRAGAIGYPRAARGGRPSWIPFESWEPGPNEAATNPFYGGRGMRTGGGGMGLPGRRKGYYASTGAVPADWQPSTFNPPAGQVRAAARVSMSAAPSQALWKES